MVILSASPMDDPVLYLLTTSRKPRHLTSVLQADFMQIPEGKYPFFSKETIINVSEAGELSLGREDLNALYESGEILYQGTLDAVDVATLLGMIQKSLRVARRVSRSCSREHPGATVYCAMQGRMTVHYPIVIEREASGAVSAYVPGLPVYAAADSAAKAEKAIRDVLQAYLAAHPSARARSNR